MKIKVDRKKFAAAIAAVGQTTGSTMPILNCVYATLQEGELSVECTNLDLSLRTTIPIIEVKDSSITSVAIPSSRLKAIASAIDSETLELAVDRGVKLNLNGGSSRFSILTMDPAEFPRTMDVEGKAVQMTQGELLRLLDGTRSACSDDETRYVLNGVSLSGKDKVIYAVSTDGRRLHHACAIHSADVGTWSFILPSKAVNTLRNFLGETGTVEITISDRRVFFHIDTPTGPVFIASKVVEGNFPDWTKVIPKDRGIELTLKRDALAATIKRVAMCCGDKSNSVKLTISDKVLRFNAQSPDFGSAEEEIDLPKAYGDREIAINPRFLTDALDSAEAEECKLCIRDSISPAMVIAEGFESVLMPVKIS